MKRILCCFIALTTACFCLSGCAAAPLKEYAGSTLVAQVVSVDGDTLVLQPGTLENGGGSFGPSGTMDPNNSDFGGFDPNTTMDPDSTMNPAAGQPGGFDPNTTMDPDSTMDPNMEQPAGGTQGEEPPALPDSSALPGQPGEGNMPSGGFGSSFTADGDTITLTMEDDWTVTMMKDGATLSLTTADIRAEDILTLTVDAKGQVTSVFIQTLEESVQPGGGEMPGGTSSTGDNGTAALTLTEDMEAAEGSYTSDTGDENALRVENGASVTLTNPTVTKTGDTSNTEDSDFYGMNAGVLVQDGASLTITGGSVETDGAGANGLFACGGSLTVTDTTVTTKQNSSGGLDVTGGGSITARNLTVETSGNSSAALRSDRGGGTLTAEGGSYTTHGTGSPAVYSTADITVKDAVLTATDSEALVIEGKNAITLENCLVTGCMSGTYADDNNENIHNIMLYQTMSGDADVGVSTLSITGGSVISQSGDAIYVTNTQCEITLQEVSLTLANDVLLRVAGNDSSRGWGTAGANGGSCVLTCINQTMAGQILVDEISSLTLTLRGTTVYTGVINPDGQTGKVDVTLEDSAVWELTGDSWVSSLTCGSEQIITNGYTLYVDGTAVSF